MTRAELITLTAAILWTADTIAESVVIAAPETPNPEEYQPWAPPAAGAADVTPWPVMDAKRAVAKALELIREAEQAAGITFGSGV